MSAIIYIVSFETTESYNRVTLLISSFFFVKINLYNDWRGEETLESCAGNLKQGIFVSEERNTHKRSS